jgi:hypothetical protein
MLIDIVRIILELWATQQTERIDRHEHMDKYVRTTIRELIVYLIFVAILTIGKSIRWNLLVNIDRHVFIVLQLCSA